MQFISTIRQRLTMSSPRTLGKILALGVLLAVPSLGLARLGADFFASWQAARAEQGVSAEDSLEGLLAFDAPAATLRQHQLRKDSSSSSKGSDKAVARPVLLVDDWRFTASPVNPTAMINGDLTALANNQFLSDIFLLNAGLPSNLLLPLLYQQAGLNQMVAQDLRAISMTNPPNFGMINGFLGNILLNEFFFDSFLMSMGASANTLSGVLGSQLGYNEVVAQYFLNAIPAPLTPGSPTS